MFIRPRCRSYEPLVTAQVRLRNLIKISARNFHCDDKNSWIYYTLHLSAFSKPFYTSEKIAYRDKIEWPEVNSQLLQTSPHKFICVRVWQNDNKRTIQADLCNDSSADKMLFLWGVYFSGLVTMPQSDAVKLKQNTLVFHLDGGLFTSPNQIIFEPIPEAQSNCDQNSDQYSSSPNFSIANGTGTKLSPDLIASTPRSIDSDANFVDNDSVNAKEIIGGSKYLKVRFAEITFPKAEIKSSYTIDKLLQIQEVQRRTKLKKENSKMLADRICTKSAACLNLELMMSKPIFYEPQKQSGMGKTLSRLLSQQQAPPKPETILKVHELRVKIECARFRIKLLTKERDKSRRCNKNLETQREKLKDENTEKETMTWNSLRTLSRENLKIHQDKLLLQHEVFANMKLALNETKRGLLRELNGIYRVNKNENGRYMINKIHLPDAESYSDTSLSSTEISIALGYVAHAVLIIARILNIPLRNPIRHEGSRSKIIDNIKILPPTDRIFPLFCRVMPPPNVLLYGVYLLNQNISQLKHVFGLNRGDLRATLNNLWDIMNSTSCEVLSKQLTDNMIVGQVDNSTSSVDSVPLNILVTIPSSLSPSRVSRSLDNFEETSETFRFNFNSSAPDLTSPEITSVEHI